MISNRSPAYSLMICRASSNRVGLDFGSSLARVTSLGSFVAGWFGLAP